MMHLARLTLSALVFLAASLIAVVEAGDSEARTPASVSSDKKTKNLTFDDIKFEMEKNDDFERKLITKEIEELHGKKIRIRGYILPSFQQSGIKQFVLVRDNMECCFGPGAALFDSIIVDMKPPKTANFTVRPVAVEGTFEIREWVVEDMHLAIYHLEAEAVE
jgi:hypothetical protein